MYFFSLCLFFLLEGGGLCVKVWCGGSHTKTLSQLEIPPPKKKEEDKTESHWSGEF